MVKNKQPSKTITIQQTVALLLLRLPHKYEKSGSKSKDRNTKVWATCQYNHWQLHEKEEIQIRLWPRRYLHNSKTSGEEQGSRKQEYADHKSRETNHSSSKFRVQVLDREAAGLFCYHQCGLINQLFTLAIVVESWKRGSIETCKIVEVLPSRWEGTDKDGLRICDDLTLGGAGTR